MTTESFDITIPVLDEERTLEHQVRTLFNYLERTFGKRAPWRVVIADNGSTDRTPQIARRLADYDQRVDYVRLDERGVGRALQASWNRSHANIVGYMDLDLATGLESLPVALSALDRGGYDLVYGTRLHTDATVIGRSLSRELTSRTFNAILAGYLRIHFSDGMCGFKFLRREILATLCTGGAISDGWFFSTELLAVAEWSGYKLYELPVHWTDSRTSRVRVVRLAREYLRAMRMLKKRRQTVA